MRYLFILIFLCCTQTIFAQKIKSAAEYKQRADQMFEKVWRLYRVSAYTGLFSEHYPSGNKTELDYFQGEGVKEKEVSFLWPFSGMFSAANVLVRYPDLSSTYKKYLDTLATGVWKYRDTTRMPVGYQAYPATLEKSDRYYDDNGLVCIDYCEAYLNTKNIVLKNKAEEVFEFIISGWDEKLGGGIYWLEGHKDQKPACSNGMATLAALKLYQISGNEKYLLWGKRFYSWMHDTLRNPQGIYYNDVKMDAKKNATYYTYNTGSMLESAVLLFKFTKEVQYLKEAQDVAEQSFLFFSKEKNGIREFDVDLPWFLTELFRGYEALYHIDHNAKYVKAVIYDLDKAWVQSADRYGLLTAKWLNDEESIRKPKWLLDEACIAELYARVSLLNLKKEN
ncbi:glycoside hydrolase family 76 protein [Pedobacter aquatilis]|uniref:glycoside hydrolase family 76 protein n=1 Tax=Pedobacter aquatilis TaxID=351343 RepID=UPI0025B62219|nr:glycoside hydrolase family 76 protein [Pedobacter aquatilis]